MPFDSSSTRRRFPLGKSESLEPCLRSLARLPPVDALHLAEEDEHVEHPHLAVQPALLREIADPLRVGAAAPGSPNTRTAPPSGSRMSMIMRMVVVLPAPFGPSRP